MRLVVTCEATPDGVPVDPCGTVDGVAMGPVLARLDDTFFDTSASLVASVAGDLFVQALTITVSVFVVGIVVGGVMRLIRSA